MAFSFGGFPSQVDFDRTKHLSEKSIRKRRLERERLVQLEREREERVRRDREEEERRREEERYVYAVHFLLSTPCSLGLDF
jgi:hypothetical protein